MNQTYLEVNGKNIIFPEIETLEPFMECQEFSKGIILLKPAQYDQQLRFVVSGILKSYYFENFGTDKEKQIIKWIAHEGNFATTFTTYLAQIPCNEYIEVLEDCSILSISFNNWEHITNTNEKFKDLKTNLLAIEHARSTQKLEILECSENYKKYTLFRKYFPKLAGRINELEKANYLKISRDTLNELHKKYMKLHPAKI